MTAWEALATARKGSQSISLTALFAADATRFSSFTARFDDMLLDYSKTAITAPTRELLLQLAEQSSLAAFREQMFTGAVINNTESRPALHTALRNPSGKAVLVDGTDVMPAIDESFTRLFGFAEAIRAGGQFDDVINIGIGGSDLGPVMVTAALAPYHDGPRIHFVSNVDGAHLADTIRHLDPARTLVIIASKTFTTIETMTNAQSARRWIVEALGEAAVNRHFVAVSTALDKVSAFGILPERIFGFWDWVGGRYSVWSAIGLAVMIAVGAGNFRDFLAGAETMDQHFRTAPWGENLPVLLALIGIWHRDICGYPARAILPYDQRLARLPAYLQQLDMESNGKSVTRDGAPVARPTGPLVWGEPGTNGQHAFYQLLHQGTDIIPCEFLIAATGHEPELAEHHRLLIANCLAQSQALMVGRSREEATAQLHAAGKSANAAASLAPHKIFPGNRPSITLAYRQLTPHTLGRLIALYEHRVFTEAAIWDINPFDQWGVELGKELATKLLTPHTAHDPSTTGLAAYLAQLAL